MLAAHDDLALYAVHALEDRDRRHFEAHLAGCERCRSDLACFIETLGRLAPLAEPADPPPALRERILAAVRSERDSARNLS